MLRFVAVPTLVSLFRKWLRGGEVAPGPSAEHGVRPAGGAPHPPLPLQDGPAYGEHGSLRLLHCLQEVGGLT